MQLMSREFNQQLGLIEEYWYDNDTDQIRYRQVAEIDPNLDANKKEFNQHNRASYGDSNGVHKVASIPLIVVEKWKREDGFDWFNSTDRERRAWLDKPENALFKVRPGKLSGVSGNRLSSVRN